MPNKLVLANDFKAAIFEGGRAYLNTLQMRLYKDSLVLSGTVMPSTPGNEVADSGYAPVSSPFPNVATNVAGQGKAVGINPTFVFTHAGGDFTVEGVYFTDPGAGDATVMAQAADTPFTVTAAGQVFVVEALCFDDTLA